MRTLGTFLAALTGLAAAAHRAPAQTFTVTSNLDAGAGTLRQAVLDANAFPGAATVQFDLGVGSTTIALSSMLPVLTNASGIDIQGSNLGLGGPITLNGGSTQRVLFIGVSPSEVPGSSTLVSTAATNFSISNLTITGGLARGGNGSNGGTGAPMGSGAGGGGGLGAGGAIFMHAGNLTIANVTLTGNSAVGGNGGTLGAAGFWGGGGGGGMGGHGGQPTTGTRGGGGGGFGGGADGGGNGTAGAAGQFTGGPGFNGAPGGTAGGGGGSVGGGGGGGTGTGGAGGGVGGLGTVTGTGGFGRFGGGGGGGTMGFDAGLGGFGGGGGGSGDLTSGGGGGFGGGAGGSSVILAPGGFGGGNNTGVTGGGGAGLGGALFVRQGATISIADNVPSFSGNTVMGGSGGAAGSGIGPHVFLAGSVNYTVSSGTLTFTTPIDGGTDSQITGNFNKFGAGTLVLTAASTYTGTTTVSAGTLRVNNSTGSGTGSGSVSVQGTATLAGTGTVGGSASVLAGGTVAPGSSPGKLTVNGNVDFAAGSSLGIQVGGLTNTDADRSQLSSAAGVLTFTGTAPNPFTVNVSKFGAFAESTTATYTIASFGSIGSTGLDGAPVTVTQTGASDSATNGNFIRLNVSGFAAGSMFTLSRVGTILQLSFTPVPEPAAGLVLFAAWFCLLWRLRGVARPHVSVWGRTGDAPSSFFHFFSCTRNLK